MFYVRPQSDALARAKTAYEKAALVPGGTPAQALRKGRSVGRGPVIAHLPTLSPRAAAYSRVRAGLTLPLSPTL